MRISAVIVRGLVLPALALSTLACDALIDGPGGAAAAAEKRVEVVLAGMQEDGGGSGAAIQQALCTWYNGQRYISDRDEAEAAMDGFDRWTRQQDLYGRKISSYEIAGSEVVEGADPETAIVSVKIEGRNYRIRVPAGNPMSWEGRSRG